MYPWHRRKLEKESSTELLWLFFSSIFSVLSSQSLERWIFWSLFFLSKNWSRENAIHPYSLQIEVSMPFYHSHNSSIDILPSNCCGGVFSSAIYLFNSSVIRLAYREGNSLCFSQLMPHGFHLFGLHFPIPVTVIFLLSFLLFYLLLLHGNISSIKLWK